MLQGAQGEMYYFGMFLNGYMIISFVQKIDESTSKWQFLMTQIQAESVSYSNDALPNVNNVRGALNNLIRESHTHANKAVLDKFSETDGKPTYEGEALGSDFIIKMTVTSDDNGNYTVTSCDATVEQIDAAVANEKRVVLIATDTTSGNFWELPIIQALQGDSYYFGTCLMTGEFGSFIFSFVQIESGWQFSMERIDAGNIDYESVDFGNMSVGAALDMSLGTLMRLYPNSHTHANKDTLDKLSDSNGKLQYNGSDVGAKGDKGEDGKTAYQYAQDGGYTGTETEFAEKLAQEQLTGTTIELTPTQVYNAVSAGIPVKVQYLHDVYGLLSFTAFNIAESFSMIVSQTIVYYNNTYILAELNGDKSGNRWRAMFTTLAEKTDIPDIPTLMPNPHALTFTGAVTGNYDGSAPMTVNIPSAVTDEHINSLIDTKLGVIENSSY